MLHKKDILERFQTLSRLLACILDEEMMTDNNDIDDEMDILSLDIVVCNELAEKSDKDIAESFSIWSNNLSNGLFGKKVKKMKEIQILPVPDLRLADHIFTLFNDKSLERQKEAVESLLTAIKEGNMAPLYLYLHEHFKEFPFDIMICIKDT
ncbi:hypothetical protein PCK1_002886 [Pneumocystis canis]|nr:hypothetical protein PCK1_002886 [Pneumocystis canis]